MAEDRVENQMDVAGNRNKRAFQFDRVSMNALKFTRRLQFREAKSFQETLDNAWKSA